jgi:hypothetical protein
METAFKKLALRAAVLFGLLAAGGGAQAATVTFQWVPLAGTSTSGTLTLTSASIVDPNNFTLTGTSSVIAADLTAFSYSFSGGTIDNTLAHVVVAGTPAQLLAGNGSWTASGGKLTSPFTITTATNTTGAAGLYALIGGISLGLTAPANALSGAGTYNALTGTYSGTLTQGYWQATSVPLPAALPLLLSGVAGLGALRRRRRVSPSAAIR